MNSKIAGPVIIEVGQKVSFGHSAILGSSLSYSAPTEAEVDTGAKIGSSVMFTKREIGGPKGVDKLANSFIAIIGILMLLKFVSVLVAAMVLTLGFKDSMLELSTKTIKKFWKKVGIGFATIVVAPFAILALVISIVGFYLAIFIGFAYGLILVMAGIYSCILTGALLARFIKKEPRVGWKWTLLGTVVLFALSFIPIIGWIACALIYLAAVGGVMWSVKRDAKEKMRIAS